MHKQSTKAAVFGGGGGFSGSHHLDFVEYLWGEPG